MKTSDNRQIGGNSHRNGIDFSYNDVVIKAFYEGNDIKFKEKKIKTNKIKSFIMYVVVTWLFIVFAINTFYKYSNMKYIIILSVILIVGLYLLYMKVTAVSKFHGAGVCQEFCAFNIPTELLR